MFSAIARGLASLSLVLKQPLQSFCELETAHGDALVTTSGHYLSWIRVDGMQKMAERKDFSRITDAMRLDLSGALEARGHAIVGWYISDPDAALVEIDNLNLNSCRSVARAAQGGIRRQRRRGRPHRRGPALYDAQRHHGRTPFGVHVACSRGTPHARRHRLSL
jgi:hypothetical protein